MSFILVGFKRRVLRYRSAFINPSQERRILSCPSTVSCPVSRWYQYLANYNLNLNFWGTLLGNEGFWIKAEHFSFKMKVLASLQLANNCRKRRSVQVSKLFRGSQLQFLENICSEDDLSSKIFGTFVVKFLACLSPRIFEHLRNGIIIKGHLQFSGP